MSKLSTGRGNLVRQAEQVRQLGAKAAKRLGERWIEESDEGDAEDDAEDEASPALPQE